MGSAKVLFYIIEFINCYAAVYYSNFLFFYLRKTFGFGELENLLTAAAGGFVYIFASWQGGKWAGRYGCVRMLCLGFGIVISGLALGAACPVASAQVMIYCLWTVGICLIWPALETLISEHAGASLAQRVGIYNVTWACGAAMAYFTAGILLEKFGMESLFWAPLALTLTELSLLPFAAALRKKENHRRDPAAPVAPTVDPMEGKRFLRMAWIANPFSYVAINTIIPLIPSIAEKLHLTTSMAGVVCSLWMFARMAAFVALWQWEGWHYRFRWLAGACLVLIACFFVLLTTQSLAPFLMAQAGFGLSIGLIYYSSLYYAMNVKDHQGANAGLHEAMIGAGLFIGPAAGAATIYLFPAAAGLGAWSVGGLLCVGFSGLLFVGRYPKRPSK